MYSLIAKWTILPGNETKALYALTKLAADVQKNEPDTLLYMVHTPDFNEASLPTPPAGEVIFFEVYKDKNAFLKHVQGKVFLSFLKNYSDLFLKYSEDNSTVFVTLELLTQVAGFIRTKLATP